MALPIPTFDDQQLFGVWFFQLRTRPRPARLQWNAYAGVDGREALVMGADGYTTEATFLLIAQTLPDLANLEQTWFDHAAAGTSTTLVDTMGSTWPGVILTGIEPAEPAVPAWDPVAVGYGYSRRYVATFEHTGA